MVFPGTELAGALTACERLHANIQAAEIPVDNAKIAMTVSMGLASMSSDVPDGPALLKRADELLYVAKSNGRNQIVVECEQELSMSGIVGSSINFG